MDFSWLIATDSHISALYIITTLILGTVIRVYLHYNDKLKYFEKLDINGPEPVIFFGNKLDLMKKSVPLFEVEYYKKYGPVYGTYEMTTPALVVGDPEAIKNIMIRDFRYFTDRIVKVDIGVTKHFLTNLKGDNWRRTRNTLTPAFTSGKMKNMMPLMMNCCDSLTRTLEKKVETSEEFDAKELYGFYAMDVVAKCAFATVTHVQEKGYDNPFMEHAHSLTRPVVWRALLYSVLPKSFGFSPFRPQDWTYLEQTARSIIHQRKQQDTSSNTKTNKDLMQLMIDAVFKNKNSEKDTQIHDSEYIDENENINNQQINTGIEETVSEDTIVANTILVMAAGYETTATLLTYASYCLAMNQEIQDKLRHEITEAYKAAGNKLLYEDVVNLKYLEAIVCETLRLYSPAVRGERLCTQDYVLETTVNGMKKKIGIKKGHIVRFPIWALQHDEKYYPNAMAFQPERFLTENKDKLVPYTYLPFGGGPRICIGMRFALLEAKLALATSLLKYRFVKGNKTPETPDLSKAKVLLGATNVFIKVEKLK